MDNKVTALLEKLANLEIELSSPDAINDKKRYRQLTSEHKYLCDLRHKWEAYKEACFQLLENKKFIKHENDPEIVTLLEEEISLLEIKCNKLRKDVEILLVPPDPDDNRNVIVEIRAGTGGDEAAIFVGDCVRMYRAFAEKNGWSFELLSSVSSQIGGYKDYEFVLTGENVYRFMKYESGTHRVQRVPLTESQGRVHTSAITIAILLEPKEEEELNIDEKDLRIDTYRSSGAGGQHVNTTDSAVRITHIPTGIIVHCQEERSQIKNRAKAMRLLKAKISEEQKRQKEAEMALTRATQVGTGDRSERIRTYNFSQNRVTDHRINLTLYSLDKIMEGDMYELIGALVSFFYQKNLTT